MSIAFHNVDFSYSGGIQVFGSLTFQIRPGETIVVVGHNGAGKSTLLKLLNGILRPSSGTITVNGKDTSSLDTSRMASDVSITFQNPSHQIFASTVLKEAQFGPRNLKRENFRQNAQQALELVGLRQSAHLHPYDLSLASRKLLTIASAIAADTAVLAFDEPSVGLSQPERVMLTKALLKLQSTGKTLLIVSHDLEFSLPLCTRVVILDRGRITFFDRPDQLMTQQTLLRHSGVRLPLSFRLRQHVGLPLPFAIQRHETNEKL